VRRAHFLARRRLADAAAIRQPFGARLVPPLLPREPIVELAHQHEHLVALGVHLPHEPADRRIELVDAAPLARGVIGGEWDSAALIGSPP
jgi:hypothetical protein